MIKKPKFILEINNALSYKEEERWVKIDIYIRKYSATFNGHKIVGLLRVYLDYYIKFRFPSHDDIPKFKCPSNISVSRIKDAI